MRVFPGLALALLAGGCGDGAADERQAAMDRMVVEEAVAAESEAQAGIADIQYPKCEAVWANGKATDCGRSIFQIAMTECQRRAQIAAGSGSALLDEYAGPSWVDAVGARAVRSIDDRLNDMEKSERPPSFQVVAVALGNGTSAVESYNCDMEDLRLKGIGWFGRETVF